MYKKCKQCKIWENNKDTQEHTDWKSEHSCSINHDGSAEAMESTDFRECLADPFVCKK